MDIILTKQEQQLAKTISSAIKTISTEDQERFNDILLGMQLKQILEDLQPTGT